MKIRRARPSDLRSFCACVGTVAAERKYLGIVRRPPLRGARKWLQLILGAKFPLLVVADGARIVGWCDVAPREGEGFRHTGGLGMGLLEEARGRGLGARLLKDAMDLSRRRGIEKLELQVYASNRRARQLYRRHGFRVEGRRVRARKLDGKYDDIVLMARFLRPRIQVDTRRGAGSNRRRRRKSAD